MKRKRITPTVLVAIFIFVVVLLFVASKLLNNNKKLATKISPWVCDESLYRCAVVDLVNQERIKQGLDKLETDQDLCKLARQLAEDSELNYPNLDNTPVFSNPRYKDYLKNYSYQETNKVTINDMLAIPMKRAGKKMSWTDESLLESFIQSGSIRGAGLSPKLTNACVAVSSGERGQKPFAYFVGATRK